MGRPGPRHSPMQTGQGAVWRAVLKTASRGLEATVLHGGRSAKPPVGGKQAAMPGDGELAPALAAGTTSG